MAGEDGAGAVELLGQDQAGEGMSEGEGPEGKEKLGPRPSGFRPPAGRAYRKDDVLGALIAPGPEPGSEGFRRHLAAAVVEENNHRRGSSRPPVHPFEQPVFRAETRGLTGIPGINSLQILAGKTLELLAARGTGSDVGESQAHDRQDSLTKTRNAQTPHPKSRKLWRFVELLFQFLHSAAAQSVHETVTTLF